MEIESSVNLKRSLTFSVIILLLSSLVLHSQELPTGIKVGVQAGLSYTGLRVTQPDGAMEELDYESIASYNLNGYFKYQFTKRFGLSIEPGFVIKGADVDIEPFLYLPGGTAKYRFQYITIPIMINFSFSRLFSIGAGIEPNYLTKAELNNTVYNSLDYRDYCEEFDLGLIAGVDFSPIKLMDASIRYSYGILPVMELQVTDNTGNEVGKTKSFNKLIQLSLRFNIIKLK